MTLTQLTSTFIKAQWLSGRGVQFPLSPVHTAVVSLGKTPNPPCFQLHSTGVCTLECVRMCV